FDDIKLRLDGIHDLPDGAGPINFIKDFGDTAALMLTVASPHIADVEVELRANSIRRQIEAVRANTLGARFTVVVGFPEVLNQHGGRPAEELLKGYLEQRGAAHDVRIVEGRGFLGFDGASDLKPTEILASVQTFIRNRTQAADFHPDMWEPVVILDP